MPLIYITGVAGTGKSTIHQLLLSKGYTAFDADLDGITGWHHIVSGKPVYGPDMLGYLSQEWYQQYQWKIVRSRVEEIARLAGNQPIFLCGTSANDEDIHDLLSQVFFLTIDEETLMKRLATRQNNDWGKSPEDVDHVLRWLKPAEEYYRAFGALMLDATRPVDHVVGQILDYV